MSTYREINSVNHSQTAFVDIPGLIRKQFAPSWVVCPIKELKNKYY